MRWGGLVISGVVGDTDWFSLARCNIMFSVLLLYSLAFGLEFG